MLNCENPVNDLISMVDDEYTYHKRILETLEYCVNNDVSSKSILAHDNGLSVRLEKGDWPLAIAMCRRYFNQKSDDTIRVSTLEEKMICQKMNSDL